MQLGFPRSQVTGQSEYGWWHRRPPATQRTEDQPVTESATAARFQSRTRLTVQTAEGDRVTISLKAQAQLAAASRTDADGSVQTASASASSRARVAVQGNLSDAELNDITELINALAAAIQNPDASGGGSASLLENISGLETLEGFRFSQKQTIQAGSIFKIAA